MQELLLRIDLFLDKNFGWFFTNGRKHDMLKDRIDKKEKLLSKIIDEKKQ